jgi:hypothetical protein
LSSRVRGAGMGWHLGSVRGGGARTRDGRDVVVGRPW